VIELEAALEGDGWKWGRPGSFTSVARSSAGVARSSASVLDALAVSLGIWLVKPPDSLVRASGRNLGDHGQADLGHDGLVTGKRVLYLLRDGPRERSLVRSQIKAVDLPKPRLLVRVVHRVRIGRER